MDDVVRNKILKDHGFGVSKDIASSIAEMLSLKFNNFNLDKNRLRMFKLLFESITKELTKKNRENMVFNRLICMSSIEYYKSLEMLMEKVFYNLADEKESVFKKAWFSDRLKFKGDASKEEVDNAFISIARWTVQRHFKTFLKTSTSEYRKRKKYLIKFLNNRKKLNSKNINFFIDNFVFLNKYTEYYSNFKERVAKDIENSQTKMDFEKIKLFFNENQTLESEKSSIKNLLKYDTKLEKDRNLHKSLEAECRENRDIMSDCIKIFKKNNLDTQRILSLKNLDEYFAQTLNFMKSVSSHNAQDIANYCLDMQRAENKIEAQRRNSNICLRSDVVNELSSANELDIETSESTQEDFELDSIIDSLSEELKGEIATMRSIARRDLERRSLSVTEDIEGLSSLEVPKPKIDGVKSVNGVEVSSSH